MLIFDELLNEVTPLETCTAHKLRDELLKTDHTPLDLFEENNPAKNDTIGQLISKLSCSTVQMWFNQDILYKIRFMDHHSFEEKYKGNMAELHTIIKRACDLNAQRASIVDAIDSKILEMKEEGTT